MDTISHIANSKVNQMIEDGSIQDMIEKGIFKAIETAISNQFQAYGSITKQIEDAIKNGLSINVDDLPLETYNQQMLVALKTKLGNMFQGLAAEKFMAEIDNTLAPAPKEISMKAIVETIVGFWKSDKPWNDDDVDEYATVKAEENEYGGASLNMWKKKERISAYSLTTKNSPDFNIYITGNKIRINHNHKYNPTCFSPEEAFIFKLYAAGTTVTGIKDFDPDNCDLALKIFD